jgi:LuxR family transcriptional regulator, maltose regulon positive regulatory protein
MRQKSSDQLLLTTKLTIPSTRSDIVLRPRLFNKLEASKDYPLTLLAAPAGSGKTVVLSAWAHQQQSASWVSLDSGDNDPVQFWSYVLAALDTLFPDLGIVPLSMLQSEQPASIETVLILVINTLNALQRESLLILDDYHSVETPSIHRGLSFLLDHLPTRFHLVIASRTDPPLPLSRLRARHQLVESRIDDLRFSLVEAATFLNDTMGLHLTADDIAALETRTEGWIAGLQLAALSLQGREDVATFVSAFTGSHRYIVDYLAEEVLGQQPEDIRTFLLYTSLLERLNGPLCDAVTGQSNGQIMLEQLEQANLFLLPLDDKRYWFRYHHLFAEALQFRLNQARPGLLPILYQRASTWFESYGFISEAINYALAAHDFERAATLIEPILHQMFNHGTHVTVRHWLQALPEEVLYARPSLCLQYAWAFLICRCN